MNVDQYSEFLLRYERMHLLAKNFKKRFEISGWLFSQKIY